MSNVKGSTLLSRLKYIDVKGTPEIRDKVIDLLSEDFKEQVGIGILMVGWYNFDYYAQLHRAIDKVMGKGDLLLLQDIGKFSAEVAVHGVTKIFFKLGNPGFIIKRAGAVWKQHYSSGIMEAAFHTPKDVTFVVKEFEEDSPEMGAAVEGWIKRTVELAGGKNVTVTYKKFPDDKGITYEYKLKWE